MFQFNTDLTSYKSPIIRLIICITAVFLIIGTESIIPDENMIVRVFVTIISATLVIICIVRAELHLCEIISVAINRKEARKRDMTFRVENCVPYSSTSIISLLENNDIIEIAVLNDGNCLRIEATSDSKNGSSVFFNKQYRIDSMVYDDISPIVSLLEGLEARDHCIHVITIDGVKPISVKLKHD